MGHRRRSLTRRLRRRQRGGGRFNRLPLAANAGITPVIEAVKDQLDPAITAIKDQILQLKSSMTDILRSGLPDTDALLAKVDAKVAALEADISHTRNLSSILFRPELDAIKAEFRANWDFMLTIGHGKLLPGPGVPVPENTYVIFNSPSGCMATSFGSFPFSERTLTQVPGDMAASLDVFYHDIAVDHMFQQGLLETFTEQTRQAYLAGAAFKPGFFANTTDPMRRSTLSRHIAGLEQKRTIYGPREPVPNMSISYVNNLGQQLILGTYTLPIDSAFQKKVSDAYRVAMTEAYRSAKAAEGQNKRNAERIWENAKKKIKEIDQGSFGAGSPNLTVGFIGHKKMIADVFAELPPVPAGRQRLLFIPACRGLEEKLENANYANIATRGRRASVAAGLAAGPGPNTMAAYEAAYQTAYNAKFPKLSRPAAAIAAEEAALADSPPMQLRKMVKHLLGTENHADLARATARNTGFQKLARTEAARQRGAVAGGAPPPGTNAAFDGAAPEFALPAPVAAAAGGEEAGAEEAAEAPAGEGGAEGGPEGNARRTRRRRSRRV